MAETQALGATGLNACGSVSADALTSPVPGEQKNFNVAFVVTPAPGQYQIKLFNPIPREMGMIHVTIGGLVAGLTWRLLAWTVNGLITIEIDLGAVPTPEAFEFDVVQTNLDSANSL